MLEMLPLVILPAVLVAAAARDVASFTIPNWMSLALIAGFILAVAVAGLPLGLLGWHAAVGVAVLTAGMVLFALNWFGGGDAKLLAATALWMGPAAVLPFLFWMALAGGALALALLAFRRWPLCAAISGVPWILRLHSSVAGVPYGLAIAIGGVAAFPSAQLFAALAAR